ncbi:uncharacterized protein LAESUDRAFT_749720 [Laetiporus sulphureus 93-53]|uniref:DUF6699 domain-containing protein n=1 Tax=Laetiporus sulphureus 93-53 TaxID=1314785 RepID=A0A165EIF7_9APHY|nr:uncharacterized protein LAESUDRAFT_749720 [Laetiporus sulphureus 93-53]KZT07119.1 hypothetical protein LAESUDRAFT_749720 [Laetiporus sulphureus 93-53]
MSISMLNSLGSQSQAGPHLDTSLIDAIHPRVSKLYTPSNTPLEINPRLVADVGPVVAGISWDAGQNPWLYARFPTGDRLPLAVLLEPATEPRLNRLVLEIATPRYPWAIEVVAPPGWAVTIGIVLEAIYKNLQMPVQDDVLGGADVSDSVRSEIWEACECRMGAQKIGHIRRIDLLRGIQGFNGLILLDVFQQQVVRDQYAVNENVRVFRLALDCLPAQMFRKHLAAFIKSTEDDDRL